MTRTRWIRLAPCLVVLALAVAARGWAEEAHRIHGLAHEDFGPLDKLLDNARYDEKRDAYFTRLDDRREAELTFDPRLEAKLEKLLVTDGVPSGAIVLMDPRTGRVLAAVGRLELVSTPSFVLKAAAPAASVFKIITSAALIEAGIDPDRAICFHGGGHSIEEKNLEDDRHDNKCASLEDALGGSVNLVFGKLAARSLKPETLRTMATRFLFNQPLPLFPAAPQGTAAPQSTAEIPDDPDSLDYGRTAAGFGNVRLSAVHGAVLADAVANKGMAVAPRFVEALWTDGRRDDLVPTQQQRVIAESTADKLVGMMQKTVDKGTARKSFHEGRRTALGPITVAGKTGTLADKAPYREHTWFVGFAPVVDPQIVVSALAINTPKWRTRGAALARDALRIFFRAPPAHRVRLPGSAPRKPL